jgi:predicted transcriptional regulator
MKKLPPRSIRFDPDVKEHLDRLAEEQDRDVTWLVNAGLRAHYGLEKPKPAKTKPKGK